MSLEDDIRSSFIAVALMAFGLGVVLASLVGMFVCGR